MAEEYRHSSPTMFKKASATSCQVRPRPFAIRECLDGILSLHHDYKY